MSQTQTARIEMSQQKNIFRFHKMIRVVKKTSKCQDQVATVLLTQSHTCMEPSAAAERTV